MPDRPKDYIDYDDDAPAPAPVDDGDADEGLPIASDANGDTEDEGFRDDEDAEGNLREGIGRAAAVLKFIVERIVDEPERIAIAAAQSRASGGRGEGLGNTGSDYDLAR